VVRYRCLTCRKTFGQQAFDPTYYKKKAHLLEPIAAAFAANSCHRQIARTVGCAPSTVTHWIAHLGRHSLLLLNRTSAAARLHEPIVYDHLETFAHGQDYPCGIGIAVGHRSWFAYGLDFAAHRRTGQMTTEQKIRQERIPRPKEDPYRRALRDTARILLSRSRRRLHLITDGKPSYVDALRSPSLQRRVLHEVHPNPRRTPEDRALARARDRAMFPSDQLHALLRHSSSNLKRETIAFSKRHNALLERIAFLLVWRNLVKRRSERVPEAPTAAMVVGITKRPWSWEQVFGRRLFPWRERLPASWERIYRRLIVTTPLAVNRPHALRNAF